jgi:hypothetical protein
MVARTEPQDYESESPGRITPVKPLLPQLDGRRGTHSWREFDRTTPLGRGRALSRSAQPPITARTAVPANRIDNHASHHNQNPLKTNTQRPSHSRIPPAAMLYSRRVVNVFHSRSVLRTTARRFVERQNSLAPNRLPHRPNLRYLFAKGAILLPDRQPPARPPPIDRIHLAVTYHFVDSKGKIGFVRSNSGLAPNAQFCTNPPNRAQVR